MEEKTVQEATEEKAAQPAPTDAKPAESKTAELAKEAVAVIDAEEKQAEIEAKPAETDNSPEVARRRKPAAEPPRQVMKVKGARGTNTRLPPAQRRRNVYVDESVPVVRSERRYATEDYSYAYFKVPTYYFSDSAQIFFERNFQRVDRSLLVISLICSVIGGDQIAKTKTEEAEELCRQIQSQILAAIEEFKRGMTANNVPEARQVPSYDHKRLYTPAVHTPQGSLFIDIVKSFDRLLARIDGAWFNGMITPEQRREMIGAWTTQMNRFVGAVLTLRGAALEAAKASGKRQDARRIEQRVESDKSNENLTGRDVAVEEGASAPVEAAKPEEAPKAP